MPGMRLSRAKSLRWWLLRTAVFVSEAAKSLPAEPWDSTTWRTWTDALKLATDRKGKQLFMPLRLALTGLDHGPELAALLPLIGRQKAMDRLA